MTPRSTSTASSGPAGSHFEAQVAAHYLLSMLIGAEPRGLPGTSIDRIELQRAGEGRPLDDVIVHAHDANGRPAVLEIQVKRAVKFSPSDVVFREVVGQIVTASRRPDFWITRYELAIAIARTSQKIDGAYQDVLTWARQIGDAATFVARIERAGAANEDMRVFLQTFRSHLRSAGAPDDDATLWGLLRKLQILVFDFTAVGSVYEELARDRAAHALHADDRLRAGALWSNLIELAQGIAIGGGDRTRATLVTSLAPSAFRFAADRRHGAALALIAEASRLALADIGDRVGRTMLTRVERIAKAREALDRGRYVEIRGDAGVGKSGLLRHFAEQVASEANVIVLSPGRCVARGWAAMQAQLRFDGTAHDLLVELASAGGAVLFVDNLDFFSGEERTTVIDLVREAAGVPGLAVVATARLNFGVDEPSWLPADALDRLGRTAPIVVDELTDSEVDQLRTADRTLIPLLGDTHPARKVTRNLFRLARLVAHQQEGPVPRTEVEMAVQWWETADGGPDGRRERGRLLRDLADQTLQRTEILDVRTQPSSAIDALISSESLRDLGSERVAFRHDVLREWAVANMLAADPNLIDRLQLERPAPVVLARGIELAARMSIEHASDQVPWRTLVDRLSQSGVHGSWRRAAILALVRSEVGTELLERASPSLLADSAAMLRELIRTVMAVDVVPATEAFTASGIDPAIIPASLNVPNGSSWIHLIRWLLSLGPNLPPAAIPEVVGLYTTWCVGTFGVTRLTPPIVRWFYQLLSEIEPLDDAAPTKDQSTRFWDGLNREQVASLKSDLRTGFVLFCQHIPDLAAAYLTAIGRSKHNDDIVRSIMKMRGALAQAAPAELAELTANALIAKPKPGRSHGGYEREEPFSYLDHEFLSASPMQGPFWDLLTHAPAQGLSLIRRLVDHAVTFLSNGALPGDDVIVVPLPEGDRSFPWVETYLWSRHGNYYCVTSALMALEAWAHQRIDNGDAFEVILADVLGSEDAPAAYLMVAVDLLLSHRPASHAAAVPFLGSPELLCLDLPRLIHDNAEFPDFLGLDALQQKEPIGPASLAKLKARASRRGTLDKMLAYYAERTPSALRDRLVTLLRSAAERLGPAAAGSSLGDPAFMAVHALNILDPKNWRDVAIPQRDGTTVPGREYVSPEAESAQLGALQNAARDRNIAANMQAAISLAIDDPNRLTPEQRKACLAWAHDSSVRPKVDSTGGEQDVEWIRKETVLTAAMILMRDGDSEDREKHEGWARSKFIEALTTPADAVHQVRGGIRFNPIALAFVGMSYALKHRPTPADMRLLLEVAARDNPAAAHGYGVTLPALVDIDPRLPVALLRCAFLACIQPIRDWDAPVGELELRSEQHRKQVCSAIDAELTWLSGSGVEPEWPRFPDRAPSPRRRLRLPGGAVEVADSIAEEARPTERVHSQSAALWLRQVEGTLDVNRQPWLRTIAWTYMPWTTLANGGGMDSHDEFDNPPREWNDAFFSVVASCLPGLQLAEVEQLALVPIASLPDQSFFDVVSRFLRSVDSVFFNDNGLDENVAVTVRSALAARMLTSSGWLRLRGSRSMSIERHIGPAIAVFFFNEHGFVPPTKCYLLPKGIDRLNGFLPGLETMTTNCPSPFVALVTLNLLEVSPRPEHLGFIVAAATAFLSSFADFAAFWVDQGFGRRVCALIHNVHAQAPSALSAERELRPVVDRLLAALVSLGVAEARRLEEALQAV